jgi:hypothetical protein
MVLKIVNKKNDLYTHVFLNSKIPFLENPSNFCILSLSDVLKNLGSADFIDNISISKQ